MPVDRLLSGHPGPLGANADETGVNFALFSEHADGVELCLFDESGEHELRRLALPEHTDGVWHGYLPEGMPGLRYNYRVHGPDAPERGHRFDSARRLLDPYARCWNEPLRWAIANGVREPRVPCCVVSSAPPPVSRDARPSPAPWRTVIYEAHVKGLTARHPRIGASERGTYAALGSPVLIDHLLRLGVTAIELMPCQAFLDERRLVRQGLVNYWGYNPVGFFVVEPRYAATADPLSELRGAVSALHEAGIEVILDVVYNHTGEGDALGPTVSFRGIDNASYYRLEDGSSDYVNATGCGNTLDLSHPRVLQLVMDSLRYWVEIVGVDGFRFDLAVTLGREAHGFERGAGFFDAIRQDPVLDRVRLIAEPWDIGDDGYQLGGFPSGWLEWNDRYRDTVRRFWRGDEPVLPDLAARVLGSADIFDSRGRRAWASVNHVTAHDGFTLHDLVSYEERHNEANLEGNRDGHAHNLSWNNGSEGPSDDPVVRAARLRDRKNLLATLFLSQGTPMLLMGDELGRTQGGNNNAYCQDNPTTWVDWRQADEELLAFTRRIIAIRHRYRALRRTRFMHGEHGDVRWWHPQGREMSADDWHGSCIGMLLDECSSPAAVVNRSRSSGCGMVNGW